MLRLCRHCIELYASSRFMNLAPLHWFRVYDSFRVSEEYAKLALAQSNWMVSRHLVQHLDDFFPDMHSTYNDGKRQCPQMSNRTYPLKFDVVVQITSLLCACHATFSTKAYQCVLGDQAMAAQVGALLFLSDQHTSDTKSAITALFVSCSKCVYMLLHHSFKLQT